VVVAQVNEIVDEPPPIDIPAFWVDVIVAADIACGGDVGQQFSPPHTLLVGFSAFWPDWANPTW
jgi:hypothetical protein